VYKYYEVQNSLRWNAGGKYSKTRTPFPLLGQEEKQKFLDLTKRGKSDDIEHGSIIQVSTVYRLQMIGLNSWPKYHPGPEQRHPDIQERHVDNVGEWLIQTEEFRKWGGSGGEV